MQKDLVTAIVKGVIPAVNSWALFLGNEEKTFVIYIDAFVAKAIQMTLSGVKNGRASIWRSLRRAISASLGTFSPASMTIVVIQ